jgi:hypothetical protein
VHVRGRGGVRRAGLGAVCVRAAGETRAHSLHATHLGSVGSRLAGGRTCPWDVDLRGEERERMHVAHARSAAGGLAGPMHLAWPMWPHVVRGHACAREPIDRRTYLGSVGCLGARDHGGGELRVQGWERACTLDTLLRAPCRHARVCGTHASVHPSIGAPTLASLAAAGARVTMGWGAAWGGSACTLLLVPCACMRALFPNPLAQCFQLIPGPSPRAWCGVPPTHLE